MVHASVRLIDAPQNWRDVDCAYLRQTTRTAVSLVISGTLLRFRKLAMILRHAGGALPMLASRLNAYVEPAQSPVSETIEGGHAKAATMNRFWFDLALTSEPNMLAFSKSFTGAQHLLFGSDIAFARPEMVSAAIQQQRHTFDDLDHIGGALTERLTFRRRP